jgi:hypothetical protein
MPPKVLGSERSRLIWIFALVGAASLSAILDPAMTVFIYVDTSKEVGDRDHLKVFASADAAETWFAENDPEGVAFEYEVLE